MTGEWIAAKVKQRTKDASSAEEAFGINLSHAKPNYSDIEDEAPKMKSIQAKMKSIQANPELAKHLPNKFAGPNGTYMDKYGNALPESPKPVLAPYYSKKFIETLKAQTPLGSGGKFYPGSKNDYKPLYTKPNKYSVNDDQELIQKVGFYSNLNVRLQQAYSPGSFSGKKIRLVCRVCEQQLLITDETMFIESKNQLVEPMMKFCSLHRHDSDEDVAAKVKATGKVPEIAAPVGGRFFMEDE